MSIFRDKDADETLVLVFTGENLLRDVKILQHTVDAPVLYLQIYDVVAPTVGTTAPNHVVRCPAGITGQVSVMKQTFHSSLGGIHHGTALSFAVTTTHDGNGAPDAGDEPEVILNYHPMA